MNKIYFNQHKPINYDSWSSDIQNAYDDLLERATQSELRATKAEAKLAEIDARVTQEISHMLHLSDVESSDSFTTRILNEILIEAASSLDPNKIFEIVTQTVFSYLNCSSTYICSWHAPQKKLTVLAEFISEKAGVEEYVSDVGMGYQFDADFEARFKESPNYWIIHHDDDDLQKKEIMDIQTYGLKTCLYVPMYANGELFGFIEAWDTKRKRDYSKAEIDFVVSVAHQIASSVRMAQLYRSLAESEQRYRLLMDTMQGGVAQVDMDGIIQYANRHFIDMMTLAENDLIGQNLEEVWHKHITATDIAGEYLLISDYGQKSYIQRVHAPILTDSQQQIGEVIVFTDITKHKEAEKIAVDLAIEQERTQLLGQFIQDASHEFYTPLSIINTKVHILSRQQQDERLLNSLTAIQNQSQNISNLVKTLVQITKLDSLEELPKSAHNLKHLLTQVTESLVDTAADKQQKLIVDAINPDTMLICNANYLTIALNNLIHNALRYTHEGGTIVIQISETEDSIGISVQDNGIGMSKEEQSQIFNRFYRADTAHSTRGFGLGLAVVKRVVDLHQGYVSVESIEGKGTAINIGLPKNLAS